MLVINHNECLQLIINARGYIEYYQVVRTSHI